MLGIYPLGEQARNALWGAATVDVPALIDGMIPYILSAVPIVCIYYSCAFALRSYCFARAETAEKCKLFDYLKSDGAGPVREQLWKGLFDSALVLLVLLTLLGAYCVLRLLV